MISTEYLLCVKCNNCFHREKTCSGLDNFTWSLQLSYRCAKCCELLPDAIAIPRHEMNAVVNSFAERFTNGASDKMKQKLREFEDRMAEEGKQVKAQVKNLNVEICSLQKKIEMKDTLLEKMKQKLVDLRNQNLVCSTAILSQGHRQESGTQTVDPGLQGWPTRGPGWNSASRDELVERAKRVNNIMLFRLPESSASNPLERKQFDISQVESICDFLGIQHFKVENCYRVGEKDSDRKFSRPLKVVFASFKTARIAVLKAFRLKNYPVKKLFLRRDLTVTEMIEQKSKNE